MVNTQCKIFNGRKNNSCNVSKLVVHALHSNFAMDILELWNTVLIFRIKTGGGGGGGVMEAENKRNIFIVGKILTSSKSRGVRM